MKPKYSSASPKTLGETFPDVSPDDQHGLLADTSTSEEPGVHIHSKTRAKGRASSVNWNVVVFLMGSLLFLLLAGPLILGFLMIFEREHPPGDGEPLQNAACRNTPTDTDYVSQQSSPVSCMDTCVFTLVESIPQNLTFEPGKPEHLSTYSGLKRLLALAKKSVRIASFYWTLRGPDISFYDNSAQEGEDIFNSLLQLSKTVSVQIAQNAANNDTYILSKQGKAEVRTLNFTRLMSSGILHTKFWLVDDQHFYVGSANLDWRSLTQVMNKAQSLAGVLNKVKELGILVQNCPCLAKDMQKIFDVYWYLGLPNATVPAKWPISFSTDINADSPATVHFNGTQALVYMSSSPPPFCPRGRTTDIDAIVEVIGQAKHFVYIAVMDYSPTTQFQYPNKYWPVIDDALRHAAFDRHISVRLLASQWKHTHKDMYAYLCSLKMLHYTHYPKINIEVKLFEVPVYTKNQSEIPFSRVNHNKYMVTDQHAYIGTSNWSGDYFTSTAGVGFVVKQPENTINTTEGDLRGQLYYVFNRDWYSNYTHDVHCDFNFTQPARSKP